jgi:DNA-binding NarL/FixJ family response regulator
VVVADDHPIWRTGVRTDLGENFRVVAEAADAADAVNQVKIHRPDVVLWKAAHGEPVFSPSLASSCSPSSGA